MHRTFRIVVATLLTLTAIIVPGKQLLQPPVAQASGNWSGASASGSGAAPWDTFNSVGLGGGASLHVNLVNGSLMAEMPGLVLPQINGFNLSAGAHYNSISKSVNTDLGNGWLMGTGRDIGLIFGSGTVTFYDSTGRAYVFSEPSSCNFVSPSGMDAQLSCDISSSYKLSYNQSNLKLFFNSSGFLTETVNRAGNQIFFGYDGLNRLTTIQGPLSGSTQDLSISYNAQSLVSQVSDQFGRTWSYGYDASNNLTSVTDAASDVTQFGYDAHDNLNKVTDPNGNVTLISYTLGSGGTYQVSQIVRVTNPSNNTGPTWNFSYNTSTMIRSELSPGGGTCGTPPAASSGSYNVQSAQVTDPNGHATTYYFNLQGPLVEIDYPGGFKVEKFAWNTFHLEDDQQPSGALTTYSYVNFNLTQVTLPNGACEKAAYANTSQPYLPSSTTDAQGNTTSYQYDSRGLVTQATDPTGHSQSIGYNTDGTVASETDENGNQTTHIYNSLGLPSQDTRSRAPAAPSARPATPTTATTSSQASQTETAGQLPSVTPSWVRWPQSASPMEPAWGTRTMPTATSPP